MRTQSTSSVTKSVAFKKLTNDEDRTKFIEQFWKQCDPAPSTPEDRLQSWGKDTVVTSHRIPVDPGGLGAEHFTLTKVDTRHDDRAGKPASYTAH